MKTKLLTLLCTLMCAGQLFAYDFYVDGIYYNKLGGDSVEVTYQTTSYNSYSGSVTIPETVTYSNTTYRVTTIGESAFRTCNKLTSITIPNSVTTIGGDAFRGCKGLTSVTIGNAITTIGEYAFHSCRNLTSIDIPNSVTTIGMLAFDSCESLISPVYNANCFAYMPKSYTEAYTIPSGIKQIAGYAFSGCSRLTSITIPNSVTTIGDNAFNYCSGLTSVTIPNSVTTIGYYAFYNCSGLTSVTIGNSVTTIGRYAFYYCRGLTSVTIGNSVTTIGDGAFGSCDNLSIVTIEATTPPTLGGKVVWPNSGSYCVFYIPCGTETAYQEAWGYKTFIEPSFDYALTLKESEYGIVQNTAPLTCANNVAVLLAHPQAGYHFTQWNDGNTDNPRSVVITQDTTMEAFFAMDYSGQCGDNLYWKYNNGILKIYGYGNMYDGQPWSLLVDSITEVSLPDELTTIGAGAFANVAKLNSITIPALVTAIGEYAFDGCRKLFDIYCYAIEPPVAQTSSFVNYNVYLHVPCDNLRDYQMDAVFGSFKYIECIGAKETPITTDDVTVTPEDDKATLVWPADDQAAGYSIEISKDGVVFCTLKFNAQGQLIGIAFAPSRNGMLRTMQAAEMTAKGWQFTVTGLTPGSKYVYTVDVINAQQQSIKQYTGEFTTTGGISTDIEWLTVDNAQCTIRKMIIDNQLFIFRGGKIFNAAGGLIK